MARPSRSVQFEEAGGELSTGRDAEQGFVLVAVLWVAALLSVYAVALSSATVDYIRTSRNTIEHARAEMLADSGIRLGLIALSRSAAPDGDISSSAVAELACRLPDGGQIGVLIEEEAGKVDINLAGDDLMRTLLMGAGLDDESAVALVAAIADYRDGDDDKRVNGAELAEYEAAGRPEGPKNAAFDSVLELADVLGMTEELFRRLKPFLTVHSGRAGIDARKASPDLIAMLSGSPSLGAGLAGPVLPARFLSVTGAAAYTVRAEGRTAAGTRSVSAAVVTRLDEVSAHSELLKAAAQSGGNVTRLRQITGSDQPPRNTGISFLVRQWDRAARELPASVARHSAALPDC